VVEMASNFKLGPMRIALRSSEAVKVYASLKTTRLTKIEKGQYQIWRNN
jgi:hypothetical protein